MRDPDQLLTDIEADLRAAHAEPPGALDEFLQEIVERLCQIPKQSHVERRIKALIEIGSLYYVHGGSEETKALPHISLAAVLASEANNAPLLRRALSVKGLVINGLRDTFGALQALESAREIASQLNEDFGEAAAWLNMGNVLNDAGLVSEASACFDKGLSLASSVSDLRIRLNLMVQSLHGRASCANAKGSNEECVNLCEQAIKLLQQDAPRDSFTLQRLALYAALAAMSLVALNRVESAAEYSLPSMEAARESGAERAILSAICASCQVEAARGRSEAAIAQLESIRERSLLPVASHHEYLRTAIIVFERAGRPDAALSAYRSLMNEIQRGRSAGMRHALARAVPDNDPDISASGKSDPGPQLSHFAARTRALLSRARFSVAKL